MAMVQNFVPELYRLSAAPVLRDTLQQGHSLNNHLLTLGMQGFLPHAHAKQESISLQGPLLTNQIY